MFKYFSITVLLIAVLLSCQKQLKSGIDQTQMDKTVKPSEDFYAYMNGTWLKDFEIPADKSNYGSFTKLADEAKINLRKIIEEASNAKDKPAGSNTQKVGDMYLSFMDSAKIEELGVSPLNEELEKIAAINSKDDLVKHMAYLASIGVYGPFVHFIAQDGKNSSQYIVNIYQTGISLPDRDYYLKDTDRFIDIRAKFLTHMEKMFDMAGIENGAAKAKSILKIETMIAENHWTRVENRNPAKTYNKLAIADLDKKMSNFNWALYAQESGFGAEDSLCVFQPTYLQAANKIIGKVSLEDWKTYYTWNVLTDAAAYLSSNFVTENFDFFSRTLSGTEKDRPRWKRAVSSVEGTLGEIVGKLYVERHFKPEAKERMKQLVNNLRESLKIRIDGLEWMSAETKVKAQEKLSKFTPKIGYPDKWKDYSALEIKSDDLIGNLVRATIVEYNRDMDKLGKPIDRTEWGMTPQTVNAYYSPPKNEIVFPAAILQPPFFNMEADDAVNYGGIGAVIGHEIIHGFDDSGRQYNGDGNLIDWWTKEDGEEFKKRANVMIEQYNGYNPIDTMHVNGKLTLGENIADIGGLTVSYYAYKNSLNGKNSPVIDGMTGEQRFFLGWAQIWARKYRDEALRQRLMTDPHSPSQYRANGITSNMPEFYEAFDVKEGDAMYRSEDQRVKIW
ncbi:MAG: peptidase M13 [Calditrichaeota bacterium]|nr:MAG: peptidase M13 [Calditrichota bacterium]MBL1205692.1 peptidase M13 [Calditrichota bacterium]NOG45520.1 peptidase M13 [Calditrichota bacterium]